MSVTVRLSNGRTATIEMMEWTSESAILQKTLTDMLPEFGPSGADPWPDMTQAMLAIDKYGGEVIEATGQPEYVPGRVY